MKRTGLAAPDGATAPFEAMVPPPLGWFSRPVAALWVRRELFRRVLVRDIESSFRGSALGLLWIVLIPLVMVVLYTFVFGVVMKSAWAAETTSPFEVPLIYFAGLAIAGFFLEVVNRAPNTIRAHQSYVKKVIFPLDLLGWMLVGTAGVKLLISFSLLAIFLSVVEGRVALEVLYVPVLVAPLAVLLLGIAWILCAIGTYVRDLGQAIGKAALEPLAHGGKVYEIGGPQVMSMVELHRVVLELTGQDSDVVELPDAVGNWLSKFGWLPGAPLTRDQWLMLQRDNVPARGAPGLEAFGIRPTPLAAVGHEWLGRFHSGGKFAGRRIHLTATN